MPTAIFSKFGIQEQYQSAMDCGESVVAIAAVHLSIEEKVMVAIMIYPSPEVLVCLGSISFIVVMASL